ncbi:MAG: AsmA family protein [Desulfovibrio sp.]|jgi:AsmA protein|nr:AsmA family protein [Desulfovibrio sp.]
MKKALLVLLAGATGLIIAVVALIAVVSATFTSDDYKNLIAKAVERSTGKETTFQGDVSLNFFPEVHLKTGKITIRDGAEFGGGDFLSVEKLALSLELTPLLGGNVEVTEALLSGVNVNLKTDATGRNNWETPNGKTEPAPKTGDTEGNDKTKQSSRLNLRMERVDCADVSVSYRNGISGESYGLLLKKLNMSGWPVGAMAPLRLSGSARDEKSGAKAAFSLKAAAGLDLDGAPAVLDIEELELSLEAQDSSPLRMKSGASLKFFSALRWSLANLRGNLSAPAEGANPALSADFSGQLQSSAKDGENRPLLAGELKLKTLDLDRLLQVLEKLAWAQKSEMKGAPNLPKTKVAGKPVPEAQKTQPPAPHRKSGADPGVDLDLRLGAESLSLRKITLTGLAAEVKLQGGEAIAPYSFKIFQGELSGRAVLNLRGPAPAFALSASLRDLDLIKASETLVDKYRVSGKLKASLDVKGKGQNSTAILHSLEGKVSVAAAGGEVSGFKLIPADLPGVNPLPESFPYRSISASATIDKGTALTKDISLQSPLLTGKGGGTLHIAYSQLDLGLDFMLGGLPPAVPVGIHGPLNSLSYEVDMRTFLRNSAEAAVDAPKAAVDTIRKSGGALKNLGGGLLQREKR